MYPDTGERVLLIGGGVLGAHFGLGKATSANVTVTLLNGQAKTLSAIPANQSLTVNWSGQ